MAEARTYPLADVDFDSERARFEALCQDVLLSMTSLGYPPLALADCEPLAVTLADFLYGPDSEVTGR